MRSCTKLASSPAATAPASSAAPPPLRGGARLKTVLWNSKRTSSRGSSPVRPGEVAAADDFDDVDGTTGRRSSGHSSEGAVARPALPAVGVTCTSEARAIVRTRWSFSAHRASSDQWQTRKTSRCTHTSSGATTLAPTSSEGEPR